MSKPKILIVDDARINRGILRNILEKEYSILEAGDGKKALEILEKEASQISVVLLDIVMPLMDGYEVLKAMQKNPLYAQIPVIVTSGQDKEDAEIKALSLGANDYILKPYKPIAIKHRIANTIFLRETASFVNSVQKDELTGVMKKEYFYLQATNLIESNPDQKYDIITCDIKHFKIVNDLFGTDTGDKLLKYVADTILDELKE